MATTLYICYFGVRQPLVQTQVIPYLLEITKSDKLRLVEPEDEASKRNKSDILQFVEPEDADNKRNKYDILQFVAPVGENSKLKFAGHVAVSLLTFEPDFHEKWKPEQIEAERKKLAKMGIEWHCLPYHKRFSAVATAYDIFRGAWFIRRMIREKEIDVLHGRVHVPTLMGALARKFSKQKPKLLFDIRGFFPEEYTDAGIWPENGWLYRSAKRVERWLMTEADGFVVLTEKAREILFPDFDCDGNQAARVPRPVATTSENPQSKIRNPKLEGRSVEVIPCCVDLKRFETANAASRTAMRRKLRIDDRFVMVYVGSFGGWYLTKETADFYGALKQKREDAFALILTQSNPEMIEPLLRDRGFGEDDFHITQVLPGEIPQYLSAADAAISFIKPCYSKQASSPTKNAEYLACGLPIVINDGIGDSTEFTKQDRTGVVIEEFDAQAYAATLDELSEMMADRKGVGERCRESARKRFDLENVGGARYRRLYRRLLIDK